MSESASIVIEELVRRVEAMTTVIAALHHTITQGMFQTITFNADELAEMRGSVIALQPTDAGGVTVLLELPQGEHDESISQDESQASQAEGNHGVADRD